MGNIREIRARIRSVKNTQQITKTMKMVASAKLRRTQNGLSGIRNFAQRSREILQELVQRAAEEAEKKGLGVRCAVNVRQAVIQLDFGEEGTTEVQQPDEGQEGQVES